MSAGTKNGGGHGTIHHVATTALDEAEDLERQGRGMIAKGVEMLRTAAVMRALHAIAAPNVGEAA